MKNKKNNPILKGVENIVRPMVTRKGYDPETLHGVPEEIISYVVKFIFNNEE